MSKRSVHCSVAAVVLASALVAGALAAPAQAAVTSTTITGTPGNKDIESPRAYRKAPAAVKAAGELDQVTFSFDTAAKKVFIKVRTPLPATVPSGYRISSFFLVSNGVGPIPEPGRVSSSRRANLVKFISGAVVFTGDSAKIVGRVCRSGSNSSVKLSSYSTAEDTYVISAPVSCLGKKRKVFGNAGVETFKRKTPLTFDETATKALAR